MNKKISPEKAIKRIDPFIEMIDKLLEMDYNEGFHEKEQLNTRIMGFIRAVFVDDDKKINDYIPPTKIRISGIRNDFQREYLDDLNRMKNHLIAYKEELELILESIGDTSVIEETPKHIPVTQIFQGDVENIAVGDINNYKIDAKIYLNALENALEKSNDIPHEEKESIINKVKELSRNPYITSISSSLIVECIKTIIGSKPL